MNELGRNFLLFAKYTYVLLLFTLSLPEEIQGLSPAFSQLNIVSSPFKAWVTNKDGTNSMCL